MKTYLRVLKYAFRYKAQAIVYSISTILAVIFSTATFVMLEPLLNVLFYPDKLKEIQAAPKVDVSIRFVMDWILELASQFSRGGDKSTALLVVTAFVVLMNLLGNFFKFVANVYMGTLRSRVVEDIREATFAKLVRQELNYLENQRKGDIISRVTSDVQEVEYTVVMTFESIIRDPFTIGFVLFTMFSKSWQLTLFIFIVLPISALLVSRISKFLKASAVETQINYGRIMSVVEETISGIRIIKAFNAEKYIKKIFDVFNGNYSHLTRKQWHKKALVPIFSESLMVFAVGAVLWYGGNLVYKGVMAPPAFISYMTLFYMLTQPAKSLAQSFSNIPKGIASADRIFVLMDNPITIADKTDAVEVLDFKKNIEIRDLSFAYVVENVIHKVNLNIEKGKVIAIVGPSGSGKSTLAELILRFYDPQHGQILLDGVDIKDIRLHNLRQMMAVVTQEPILFNDTFYNNIAFGLAGVTQQMVEDASRAANAHDFIMESKEGYQAMIGDRGGLLSGGQRQRISIARAVLKNPPILILDEATSSLDTQSEKTVQDALYRLMKQRTSIVIAHRLSTIQDADNIVVMEKGQIIEQGTHHELVAANGLYKGLYQLQQYENVVAEEEAAIKIPE